jgi:phospholipid/cholesterol/gamma-HCH transport system substrate-binding protein
MSENSRTFSAGFKLLVFVAVTSLATGILAVTIANTTFSPSHNYSAVFSDATGLEPGDDVRVAGVRVGEVNSIKLYRGHLAKVGFSVDSTGDFVNGLPASVQAQLLFRNLAGQRYLALSQGSGTVGSTLRPGSMIPLSQTEPALDLTALFNGFRPLFTALEPGDVNQLSYEIIQTLQGEGGTVTSLLTHVASLTNTLADRDQVIGQVITNLNSLLGTIDARRQQFGTLVTNLQQFISGVSHDRTAILSSIDSINGLTSATTSLLDKVRPSLKSDIAGLNVAAATLANNGGAVNRALQQAPGRLNLLDNSSSYGSWFNFYLCALDAKIQMPGGPVIQTPSIINDNARCK